VWAHQAAEKALKAALVAADLDPPKTHNLVRLREMTGIVVEASTRQLQELSTWSIEGRYPADLRDATRADATAAIEIAATVVHAAQRHVDGIE
jgi:HEPN domain-containing protein